MISIVCPSCMHRQRATLKQAHSPLKTQTQETILSANQLYIICSIKYCKYLIVNDELNEATIEVFKYPADFKPNVSHFIKKIPFKI